MEPRRDCQRCQGAGVITEVCPSCHGKPDEKDGGCSECKGEGYIEVNCPACDGTGEA